jgi:hypothetical protein
MGSSLETSISSIVGRLQDAKVLDWRRVLSPFLVNVYPLPLGFVRMVQRRSQLRFALEAASHSRIGQFVRQELDGYGPLELRIECSVDRAHATLCDQRQDLVRTYAGSSTKGHDI